MEACLQCVAGRREGVAVAGARRRVDDRRHRPAEVEVGDGLHRRSRVHAHELRRPRARGDDGDPRAHAAGADAVAVLVDRLDADVLAHLEAVGERRDGFVRMDDPAVRLEQAAARPRRRGCRTAARSGLRRAPRTAPRTLRVHRGSAPSHRGRACRAARAGAGRSPPRARARAGRSPARTGPSARPGRTGARSASCRGSTRARGRARTARRRRRRAPPGRVPVPWRAPSPRLRRRRPRCRRRPRAAA